VPLLLAVGSASAAGRCEQHAMPHIRQLCRGLEINIVQGDAKRRGQPVPSAERVTLPECGSADAKVLGLGATGR
jgi:hypothetical protein